MIYHSGSWLIPRVSVSRDGDFDSCHFSNYIVAQPTYFSETLTRAILVTHPGKWVSLGTAWNAFQPFHLRDFSVLGTHTFLPGNGCSVPKLGKPVVVSSRAGVLVAKYLLHAFACEDGCGVQGVDRINSQTMSLASNRCGNQ